MQHALTRSTTPDDLPSFFFFFEESSSHFFFFSLIFCRIFFLFFFSSKMETGRISRLIPEPTLRHSKAFFFLHLLFTHRLAANSNDLQLYWLRKVDRFRIFFFFYGRINILFIYSISGQWAKVALNSKHSFSVDRDFDLNFCVWRVFSCDSGRAKKKKKEMKKEKDKCQGVRHLNETCD